MYKDQSKLSGFWAEDYLTDDEFDDNSTSKLNLFIIWDKSRDKSKIIMDDIGKKFVIRQVYEVQWSKEKFLTNLKRFYEKGLKELQQKADVCGSGPFLVVLVSDPNPIFKKMITPTEEDIININMVESKLKYRKWTGREYSIHSSMSKKETNHDLTLLFNKNIHDLEKELPETWDTSIKKLDLDIVGSDRWLNLKQLLYVFNGTINYVILRNFEGMPDKYDFNDIDLLTEDERVRSIIDGNFSLYGDNISKLKMKLGDKEVEFDFRYIKNQNYFDEKWLKSILKNRIFHPNGFYVPCTEDYFYTLLYHAIIHKGIISEKAKKRLTKLSKQLAIKDVTEETFSDFEKSKEFLNKYLKKMNYSNANSTYYTLRHNQFMRMAKVSIFILRTKGLKSLFGSFKHKIKISISNSKEYASRGKIIDKTDYDMNH